MVLSGPEYLSETALSDYRNRKFPSPPANGGEVVFNTGPCGYQEILSDPSYRGQIVLMTSTHIGNYGVDPPGPRTAVMKISVAAYRPGA